MLVLSSLKGCIVLNRLNSLQASLKHWAKFVLLQHNTLNSAKIKRKTSEGTEVFLKRAL